MEYRIPIDVCSNFIDTRWIMRQELLNIDQEKEGNSLNANNKSNVGHIQCVNKDFTLLIKSPVLK
jgi:hypothetical protein